jgi:hypothetical protein
MSSRLLTCSFRSRARGRASTLLMVLLALGVCSLGCKPEGPGDSGDGDGDGDGDEGTTIDALCDMVDCGPHGSCAVSSDSAICFCQSGYMGDMCESCAPGFALAQGGICVNEALSTRPEPAGEHCEFGGVATDRGLDWDSNGLLGTSEITKTEYQCSEAPAETCPATLCGDHGACVVQEAAPRCVCNNGYQGDRCDACAAGFLLRPADGLCSVPRTITDLRDETGNPSCPAGSYAVLSGVDSDFNGVLDLTEVRDTTSLCKIVRSGNVLVTNQAELEALAGVTDITGSLTITTRYVPNLSPLSSLVHVQGQLLVKDNGALTSLSGLGRLNSAGSVEISGNTGLITSAGLNALQRIGTFKAFKNTSLTTIDVGPVGVIEGDLWLEDNPALTSLQSGALRSVTKALVIAFHPLLTDLGGLAGLAAVGSEIWLEDNDALADLRGFVKLADAGGLLVIDCDGLLTIDGPSLSSLRGGLTVDGNDALSALNAFNTLETVEGCIVIRENDQLLTLSGFDKLTTVGGGVSVRENAKLVSASGFPVLNSLNEATSLPTSEITPPAQEPPPCDLVFGCLPGLSAAPSGLFPPFRGSRDSLYFSVEFSDNPLLQSAGGFDVLSDMEEVNIVENPQLTSIPFFSHLQRVNSMVIEDNGLTTVQLDHVIGQLEGATGSQYVRVQRNPKLTEFAWSGFDRLTYLVVQENPKLTTLSWDAFTCYQNVGTIDISNNAALTTISGLSVVETCSSFNISGNASLVTLEDFSNLKKLGILTLQNNALLEHGPSFPALTSTMNITISDNPKFEDVPASAKPFAALTLLNLPEVSSLDGMNFGNGTKDVRIENLDKLVNLNGLAGLTGQTLGNFRLLDNDGLVTTAGMGKVADLNGLAINGNDKLLDLVAFSELTQIGPLEINDNLVLPSVSDLAKLSAASNCTITDNPELPNCLAAEFKFKVSPSNGYVGSNDMAAVCD